MTVKICANNILYWGTVGLLFFHGKYTDLEFMAAVRPDLERIWAITGVLEAMYREWHALEPASGAGRSCRRGVPGDVPAPPRHGRRLRRRDAEGEARRRPPT